MTTAIFSNNPSMMKEILDQLGGLHKVNKIYFNRKSQDLMHLLILDQ
jgi:hypothetical protein